MMAKMTWLSANGVASMAVGAPNFALVDLRLEKSQGVLIEGERDHLAALRADVVELEDDDVVLSASDTRGVPHTPAAPGERHLQSLGQGGVVQWPRTSAFQAEDRGFKSRRPYSARRGR
jgi:hypothetical protein